MEQPLGGAAVLVVLKQVAEEVRDDPQLPKLTWGFEQAPRHVQLVALLHAMAEGRDDELTCQALRMYHGDRYEGQDQAITAIEQIYVAEAERYARQLGQALAGTFGIPFPPQNQK